MHHRITFALSLGLALALAAATDACTWFRFLNDQKHCFIGRTMEWPGDLGSEITRVPRGHEFGSFKGRHGFVGVSHGGLFSDGLNERGLACSGLWLGETRYPEASDGAIPVTLFIPLVLGQAATVDEALAILEKPPIIGGKAAATGDLPVTLHFSITDPSGRSVVVEFLDGVMRVFENKVGAMTNDPNYVAQMEVWQTLDPAKFDEGSFYSFDYSPSGRFCRMAAINATQAKVASDAEAVNRAWSMVNTVDIPQGILYWRWASSQPQFTSYSVVADLSNRVYYFRT